MAVLRGMGAASRARVVPDPAFAVAPASLPPCPPPGPPEIGVTVRPWPFHGATDATAHMENYESSVAEALDRMIERYSARVTFFPQVTLPNAEENDLGISMSVMARMRHQGAVALAEEVTTIAELQKQYGRMSIFLGTRLHSVILAAGMRVPSAAVSYQGWKTTGTMRILNMEDLVCSIEAISSDRVFSLLDTLWEHRDGIRSKLDRKITQIRRQLAEAAAEVARMIRER